MGRMLLVLTLLLLPCAALAQDVVTVPVDTGTTVVTAGPHFFAALLAGVILALAFQLVLTTLSLATGLQIVGAADDDDDAQVTDYHSTSAAGAERFHDATNRVADKTRKFSSALGIWAVITASIALFFASWLAVELSLTTDYTAGAVLGLVIWGLFYIVMTRIEMNAVYSVVGHVNRLAHSGLRGMKRTAQTAVGGGSQVAQAGLVQDISQTVREEFFGGIDSEHLKDRLRSYIRDFKTAPQMDPAAVRQDMRLMLHDPQAGADALINRLRSIDRETLRDIIASRPDIPPEDAERILNEMEASRDEAIAQVTRMKEEVTRRLTTAREEAKHVAHEFRKTAAAAAWWAFVAALVSGVASALGGMAAVATGPF